MAKKRRTLGRRLRDISSISSLKIITSDSPKARTKIPLKKLARVICVTSGKGGTGKSILTSNLANCFAKAGQKVVLLDADMGLANLHLLLGINPKYNISNIIHDNRTIREVMVKTDFGFSLIPGGSGLTELADLNDYQVDLLATAFAELESEANLLLIDTPAGIASQTMRLLHAANEIIVVTTPEITAITDAYADIKVTSRENPHALVGLVVNRARRQDEAKSVFTHLNMITQRYLNKTITDYGYILEDQAINKSIVARQPVTSLDPTAKASRCISEIVDRITFVGNAHEDKLKLTTGGFFERIQNNLRSMVSS